MIKFSWFLYNSEIILFHCDGEHWQKENGAVKIQKNNQFLRFFFKNQQTFPVVMNQVNIYLAYEP